MSAASRASARAAAELPDQEDDEPQYDPEPPCRDCGSQWCRRECPQAYEADREAWVAAYAERDAADHAQDEAVALEVGA